MYFALSFSAPLRVLYSSPHGARLAQEGFPEIPFHALRKGAGLELRGT